MKKLWAILVICLIGAYFAWRDRPLERTPGVLAPDPPQQSAVAAPLPVFEKNGYRITPLARFEAQARVLAKEDYYLGTEAALAPVDLALGWGRMSDSQVLAGIAISQSHRFYYWYTETFPIPRREIETHSANMHMIPADPNIEKQLKAVRSGAIVNLRGYLVEARRDDGRYWRSSLTRDDTGSGACELVWVEALEVN